MYEESVIARTISRNFQSPLPQIRDLPALFVARRGPRIRTESEALHPICCLVVRTVARVYQVSACRTPKLVVSMMTVLVLLTHSACPRRNSRGQQGHAQRRQTEDILQICFHDVILLSQRLTLSASTPLRRCLSEGFQNCSRQSGCSAGTTVRGHVELDVREVGDRLGRCRKLRLGARTEKGFAVLVRR